MIIYFSNIDFWKPLIMRNHEDITLYRTAVCYGNLWKLKKTTYCYAS